MKKIYFIIWTVVVATMFVSCERDEEARLSTISVSSETFAPSYNSVLIETRFETTAAASYYKPTLKTVYVQYSTRANFEEYEEALMNGEDYSYTYKVQLSDLQDNTTYYIRYVASNRYSSAMTKEISEFKTCQPSLPTIKIASISDIWDTHAKTQIALDSDGGVPVIEMGICWDTQTAPVFEKNKLAIKDTSSILNITSLLPNTKYYLRAYAKNKIGVAYSEETTLTTCSLPEVKTDEITDVQVTTALLNGLLVFNGNDTSTIKGFCWGDNPLPTINNNQKQVTTSSNNFTYHVSDLKDETKYYVRAYAKNKIGIVYGEEKFFTTKKKAYALPTVTTSSATNITYTSALVGGNVTSDGGATVTERGVVYSTSQNPTTSNSKKVSGSGTGPFSISLTGLLDGTTYYVRAYAINKKGIAYGEQISFTTKAYALPTVTTSSATNITYTSAIVGGNVTSDGGATITERGVIYSTSQSPTIYTKVKSGTGIGSYTCNLSNLQAETTYYVRAYATNSKGTSYGSQISFTTKTSLIGTENGLSYVDLGLSVKWATCNVGASKPEDYGHYFAWGEITTTKSTYDKSTYKWFGGMYYGLTKYNDVSSYGTVDNKFVLDKEDDAAAFYWRGNWRMPTDEEMTELRTECTWSWTTQNGVNGYKVTSNKSGYTDMSIFLPAAGYRIDTSLYNAGSNGRYWSSSLYTGNTFEACSVAFSAYNVVWHYDYRYEGGTVRPVCR